jgi:hypothetical protein
MCIDNNKSRHKSLSDVSNWLDDYYIQDEYPGPQPIQNECTDEYGY